MDTESAGASPRRLAALGLRRAGQARRKALQKKLALPENLSANALLDAVNSLYTRDEFIGGALFSSTKARHCRAGRKRRRRSRREPVESIGAGASSPICKRSDYRAEEHRALTQSVPRTMPKASLSGGEKTFHKITASIVARRQHCAATDNIWKRWIFSLFVTVSCLVTGRAAYDIIC